MLSRRGLILGATAAPLVARADSLMKIRGELLSEPDGWITFRSLSGDQTSTLYYGSPDRLLAPLKEAMDAGLLRSYFNYPRSEDGESTFNGMPFARADGYVRIKAATIATEPLAVSTPRPPVSMESGFNLPFSINWGSWFLSRSNVQW